MSLKRSKRKQRVSVDGCSEDFFSSVSPLKRTPKKVRSEEDGIVEDRTLFGQLISKAGFNLTDGDKPNLLSCDQTVFQKNLRKHIQPNPENGMDCIDKFLEALESYSDNSSNFKGILIYTRTAPDCELSRADQQDSLIRILLNIDELQPKLLTFLTEKLLEIAYDEQNSSKSDIPPLILANIRWLDHIIEPQTLADRIVDLLEGSPLEIQKEVIGSVHNIVTDEYHPKIAKVFHSLYDTTPELTPFLLDALSSLVLESEVLQEFHHSVLKTLQLVKPSNLPVVVKFLFNDVPHNLATQIMRDIRDKLYLPTGGSVSGVKGHSELSQIPSSINASSYSTSRPTREETDDLLTLIFANIQHAVSVNKHVSLALMKTVSEENEMANIKSFDLLVLAVVHKVIPGKRKAVESLIRNLVRIGLTPQPLLPETFSKFSVVVKEYFESFKKLADILILSPEPLISDFGAALYKYSFVNLDGFQQQDVIASVLLHLGDSENVRWASLCLLYDLTHDHTRLMSKYILFLKSSLDMMGPLTLRESKKLMDSLIHLAYHSPSETSLKEELNILVRKQLSHADMKIKRLGVLSAVLTLKNSVFDGDDTGTSRDSNGSSQAGSRRDSDGASEPGFERGPLRDAEMLFRLVKTTTADSPHSSALFMDELATTVLKHGFNPQLEKWISDALTSDFEETFVTTRETAGGDLPVPVTLQWNLDEEASESEDSRAIFLPIARMVFSDRLARDKTRLSSDITKLVAHFRLMRMVESHLNAGELSNIDALLVCGLELPKLSTFKDMFFLPKLQRHACLDCLFYAANWFIELVNAFATQKDPDLKKRVVLRFKKIIYLQNLLAKLLAQNPDYDPPTFLFDFDVASPSKTALATHPNAKRAKGKSSSKNGIEKKSKNKNDTTLSGISQCLGTQTQKSSQLNHQTSETVDLSRYKFFFRELHLDVFNLLFKSLSLEVTFEEQNVKFLCLEEVEFLISDLNKKLSRVFGRGNKRATVLGKSAADRDAGYSHVDIFDASEVSAQTVRYLKPICSHLEKISEYFAELISEADGVEDASSLFTARTFQVSNLFSALLESQRIILAYAAQFGLNSRNSNLSDMLLVIGKNLEGSAISQMSPKKQLKAVFQYLCNLAESIVYISTAEALVDLLEVICNLSKDTNIKEQFVKCVEGFLKKDWYTVGASRDRGAQFNKSLSVILKAFFRQTQDPVCDVQRISSEGFRELLKCSSKDPQSELFPTLKKSTLTTFYAILFENLVSGTEKCLLASPQRTDPKLDVWNVSVKTLYVLVEPLKRISTSLLLASCLKHSHNYLKLFLSKGMPLLGDCLDSKQAEVTALLKNLQMTTRFLHHLCTHAKCNQEKRIVHFVPLMKKSLETVVFRVKAMLASNKCQDAFWVGNLKNRDLQGEEILSQTLQSNDESNGGGVENDDASETEETEVLSDVDLDQGSNQAEDDDAAEQEDYSMSY